MKRRRFVMQCSRFAAVRCSRTDGLLIAIRTLLERRAPPLTEEREETMTFLLETIQEKKHTIKSAASSV